MPQIANFRFRTLHSLLLRTTTERHPLIAMATVAAHPQKTVLQAAQGRPPRPGSLRSPTCQRIFQVFLRRLPQELLTV